MSLCPYVSKCPNCGHQYIVLTGGFLNKTTPSHCPKCGASSSLLS